MTRTPRRRITSLARLVPTVLLAVVTAVSFAGSGVEAEPAIEARVVAEQVAAVRIALDVPLFEAERPSPAAEPQPLLADGERIETARLATRVRIASVGIDTEVASVGYVFRDGRLQYDVPRIGAGQYSGTATPGQSGNAVIAGHVASRSGPAVFRDLSKVQIGETIEVFRGDDVFTYRVIELRLVSPQATEVMQPTSDAMLTLITCSREENFKDRFVVIGKLI